MDSGGHISRGEEAAGGDLSESMEEDITFDNEIATALLCARGDASTIDGNDTATITSQRPTQTALVTTTVKILRVVAVRLADLRQLPANGWRRISRRSKTR